MKTREIGDIENDLGVVQYQIDDLEGQLVDLCGERTKLQCELEDAQGEEET